MPMKELEFKLKSQRVDAWLRIGLSLIKYASLSFIVWRLGIAVEALAGKATLADFGVFLLTDLRVNKVFSHAVMGLVGVSGATYGVRERSSKRKEIKRLGNRVVELEKRLDPERTSSGLKRDGTSRPEDEP